MSHLLVDLDALSPAERRDLANALLRAAWSATLQQTRILLLDLLCKWTTPRSVKRHDHWSPWSATVIFGDR